VRHARSVLAITGALFAALALAIVFLGAPPADAALRNALLSLGSPPLLAALRVVNRAGDWRVLLPGTLVLPVAFPRARRQWWLWAGLMVAAPMCEGLLKLLIRRPRPEALSFAFPSGHATAAAAFFGAAIYLAGSLPARARAIVRAAAVLAIVLVGVARVMLRAHWPSDVLAGIALGLALASLTAVVAASIDERWSGGAEGA